MEKLDLIDFIDRVEFPVVEVDDRQGRAFVRGIRDAALSPSRICARSDRLPPEALELEGGPCSDLGISHCLSTA